MDTTSLNKIEKQIEKLRLQAKTLREREMGGVIDRIKVAIEHYGLKPADLFGGGGSSSSSSSAAPANGGTNAARPRGGAAKRVGVVKYRDESGNAWTGHGKRPQWYKSALESGKTPEDLLAK